LTTTARSDIIAPPFEILSSPTDQPQRIVESLAASIMRVRWELGTMTTSIEKWEALTHEPKIVGFFAGLFDRGGVRVTDTGETFTCIHRGDHIDIRPNLESNLDYTVDIVSSQVDRLVANATGGELTLAQQYRVAKTLFTPATAATLRNPMLSNRLIRRISAVENLIHVVLVSPMPQEEDCEDAMHTLIHVAGQWLVIPGLHGKARRVFRFSMTDAIGYHRRVFLAIKRDSIGGWLGFWRWYIFWRRTVSKRE
jgi:hypothetical protein